MGEPDRTPRASRQDQGQQQTTRISSELIKTAITGRITADMVRAWTSEFRSLGGAPDWYFDAMGTTGYAMDSVTAAAQAFKEMQRHGLKRLVAAVASSIVRMGASAVAVTASFEFKVVATREEAELLLKKPRA
jgi:hypothetical protein